MSPVAVTSALSLVYIAGLVVTLCYAIESWECNARSMFVVFFWFLFFPVLAWKLAILMGRLPKGLNKFAKMVASIYRDLLKGESLCFLRSSES